MILLVLGAAKRPPTLRFLRPLIFCFLLFPQFGFFPVRGFPPVFFDGVGFFLRIAFSSSLTLLSAFSLKSLNVSFPDPITIEYV